VSIENCEVNIRRIGGFFLPRGTGYTSVVWQSK